MRNPFSSAFMALAALVLALASTPAVTYAEPATISAPYSATVESFDGSALTGGVVSDEGLAAMLIDVLIADGRYAVLEKGVAGAKPRFLIKGSIVRFDAAAGSSGVQLGGLPAAGRALGGSAKQRETKVALSLRLIDAATGRIVAVARAEGSASVREADAGLLAGPEGGALGANALRATSVGKALEDAMRKAAADLARKG